MIYLVFSLVIGLLLCAAVIDLRSREIPDWISIAIGLVAILSSLVGWLRLDLVWVLAGGLTGLLAGYVLFRFAKLGGGDAKLIAALGLLVGPIGLAIVLFVMAIAGGLLSLIAMLRGQRDFAYGPAILVGFVGYLSLVSRV